jgi:uncharacterized membrane protein YdjX (TVP38/TMEM64 family)
VAVVDDVDRQFLKTNLPRIAVLTVLMAGIAAFFALGAYRAFTFEHLVNHKDALIAWADARPILAPIAFVAAYLLLGFFGLPGSTALNVVAGVLFDFVQGLFLVILASTLASSLAFFSFRYLFRDYVHKKVRGRFPHLEEGLQREGVYFVFAMRLVPLVPYSATNLILSVSPVPFVTYLWVSLVAMLPRYVLYVYAGTHLGDVQDPDDLFSPTLIGVLAVLAVLPWVLKRIMRRLRERT